MLDRTFDKIKNIHNLSELRFPVLFFGLALWVAAPILGNIPILLSVQLDLLKPRQRKEQLLSVNNILLILVAVSTAIYISSFDIFADTRIYLDIYDTIDIKGVFDNEFVRDRYEFGLFLLLYPIHLLTNGSEYLCLLIFSLIVNFTVIFYISKNLSRKYYPTLLILVLSTFFYYSQVFYMRQFLSIMLVMMALVSMNSNWILFAVWSLLAIFSHLTAAIYIGICLASQVIFYCQQKLISNLNKSDRVVLYLVLLFIMSIFFYIAWSAYNNPQEIYQYANNIIDLLPERRLSSSIQGRVNAYDGRDTDLFEFNIFRIIATGITTIFMLVRRTKNLTPKLLSLNLIFVLSLMQIVFILITGFNQRIVYIYLVFYGFFFASGLNDKSEIKPFGLISLLTIFAAAANTFNLFTIQASMIDIKGWSFFDGQPLSASAYDYIVYFFQSI